MSSDAVYWHEGMFLRPHHFQASDRYWHEQVRLSSRFDVEYHWGLKSFEFNKEALQNFRFEVLRLQCRLRDGTLIRIPQDGLLAPLELRNSMDRAKQLDILLAVPIVQPGRANIGSLEDSSARYRMEVSREGVPDENKEKNERPVHFRRLNVQLRTSEQDMAGFVYIPLARIQRSARVEGVPELDSEYIPPILDCEAWEALQVNILQYIYHRAGKLVKQRAQQVRTRKIIFDSQSAEDRRIFESLRILNEIATYLRIMSHARGIHPLHAYMELCRILGKLSVFSLNVEPPDLEESIPLYDHDNLGFCFYTVKKHIDDLLNRGAPDINYEEVPFVGTGLRMKVDIEPRWLTPAYFLFVGVESVLPTETVVNLLTGRLNMKIGAIDNVDEIFAYGRLGLAFNHTPRPPRVLPDSRTLTYFQINRDLSPLEWDAVQKSLKMAIRLNEKLIAGNIDGQTEIAVRMDAAMSKMQFTLYIVPAELTKENR